MGLVTMFDHAVVLAFNGLAQRSFLADQIIVNVAQLPLVKMGPLTIAAVWAIACSPNQNRPLARILLSVTGAMIASKLVQYAMPARPRPLYTPGLALRHPYGLPPNALADWSSFPSDHAAMAFALSVAVLAHHRAAGIAALVWTTVVVCLPRMFMGLHFPTDLLAGAVIGIAVATLVPRTQAQAAGERLLGRMEARHAAFVPTLMVVTMYMFMSMFADLRKMGHLAGNYAQLQNAADSPSKGGPYQ